MNRNPLGYTTPPGFVRNKNRDGVVIDYKCFGIGGSSMESLTTKAEHALTSVVIIFDLYHIWGQNRGSS